MTIRSTTGPGGTVDLGRFDATREPVAEIASGEGIRYVDTLTHFLGALRPGVAIEELERLRRSEPTRGPHSIVGPVAVRDARPGDLLEVHYARVRPISYGANFHNGGALRTGALPDEFPKGHIRFFDLDERRGTTTFAEGIELPLAPFQGTFGVAPPPAAGDVVSSVPPGQHAGNIDVRELVEGTTLFIPVWREGALIFTGDSHALQGDGEVDLTAVETAMRDLEVHVTVRSGALRGIPEEERWPMAETPTHWIMIGTGPDITSAFRVALRSTLRFFVDRVGLSRADAYALASIAVSFRITQVVNVASGVHAMIPMSIFTPDRRAAISPV